MDTLTQEIKPEKTICFSVKHQMPVTLMFVERASICKDNEQLHLPPQKMKVKLIKCE